MVDNRSLDEFVGAEESAEPEAVADSESADSERSAVDEGAEAVSEGDDAALEPMAETFAWSAIGGECATCGETVEERWRDSDLMVCGDCKAW